MNLYFECSNGISGDMAVGALLDLGASEEKLKCALESIGLNEEFSYKIEKMKVNSILTTDFDVIIPECRAQHHHNHNEAHHHHRNLDDVITIIDRAEISNIAKNLAKKIFNIVAKAEAKVHGLPLDKVHFHEVGAIDSIVDIIAFSVLYDDLNPKKTYFKTLSEGTGSVTCQHGTMSVPVPAVVEIVSEYKIPLKITDNEGEMITPTGAAIAAALYTAEKMGENIIIQKTGYGRGKRPYKNPTLRVFGIKEDN